MPLSRSTRIVSFVQLETDRRRSVGKKKKNEATNSEEWNPELENGSASTSKRKFFFFFLLTLSFRRKHFLDRQQQRLIYFRLWDDEWFIASEERKRKNEKIRLLESISMNVLCMYIVLSNGRENNVERERFSFEGNIPRRRYNFFPLFYKSV